VKKYGARERTGEKDILITRNDSLGTRVMSRTKASVVKRDIGQVIHAHSRT
jgi:hypothetical protein